MRSKGSWILAGLVAALLAGCGEGGEGAAAAESRGPGAGGGAASGARVARGDAAAGEAVYRESCIMCHGEGGAGTKLGSPLATGDLGGVDQITQVVRAGVPQPEDYPVPMPGHAGMGLTDAQVRAVSAYVYFLTGR